jgi:hypothetical protein
MPSRSPAGDDRGWKPTRLGSKQRVGGHRFSPAGEREPTRGSPTEHLRRRQVVVGGIPSRLPGFFGKCHNANSHRVYMCGKMCVR